MNLHFDSSGGFRLYNIKKIRTDDIKAAKHNGYSFLWESLYIFKRKNYKIFEINVILPFFLIPLLFSIIAVVYNCTLFTSNSDK